MKFTFIFVVMMVYGEWFNGKTAAFKVGNYGIGGFVMVYSLMVKY